MSDTSSRLAVIICSAGRPDCLAALLPYLKAQTRPADHIVFSVPGPRDMGTDPTGRFPPPTVVQVVHGPKGLPRQRNTGLAAIRDKADIVAFFDDDYLPTRDAFAGILRAFAADPQVGGMTGRLIADGINGPGLSHAEADTLLRQWEETHPPPAPLTVRRRGLEGLYGCNMAYRVTAIGDNRFDEALPLYGWQEDIDFANRIAGQRIATDAFAGVHLGAKSGRETSGRKLGYSQIANPWYLWRKGTMSPRFALRLAARNLAANHLKAFTPEPWADRRARAAGNRLALWHILTARARPDHILSM